MLSLNLPFLSHKMMLEPNIYSIKREIFCAMRGGSTVVCVALFQQKDEMRKTPIISFFRDQNWLEITSVIFQWGTQDMSFFFQEALIHKNQDLLSLIRCVSVCIVLCVSNSCCSRNKNSWGFNLKKVSKNIYVVR